MANVHITQHAIERFQERVRNVTDDKARQELSSPSICAAADFGACYVKLATGQRVVISNGVIVTVLPKGHAPRSMAIGSKD